MKKITDLQLGDMVIYVSEAQAKRTQMVTGITLKHFYCGDQKFDKKTGIELDSQNPGHLEILPTGVPSDVDIKNVSGFS